MNRKLNTFATFLPGKPRADLAAGPWSPEFDGLLGKALVNYIINDGVITLFFSDADYLEANFEKQHEEVVVIMGEATGEGNHSAIVVFEDGSEVDSVRYK